MSIKAMNWAWEQSLPPSAKLILMALADAANEEGRCWPAIRVIAAKCCVSERTVRRQLKDFENNGDVIVTTRARADGGQGSNSYRLSMSPPDKLSPPSQIVRGRVTQLCQGEGDIAMSPLEPLQESKLEPLQLPSAAAAFAGCHESKPKNVEVVVEELVQSEQELSQPSCLANSDACRAVGMVQGRIQDSQLAQQVLDELDAKLQTKQIRSSWIAYLDGMIRKAVAGQFVSTAGAEIAERRKIRKSAATNVTPRRVPNAASNEIANAHIANILAELKGSPLP